MKLLVTGPQTHIGRSVINRLEKGKKQFEVMDADLLEKSTTMRFFSLAAPDAVIHCDIETGGIEYVRQHPGKIFYHNCQKNLNLYEAARESGIKKIVSPISNSTYPSIKDGKMLESKWWDGPLHDSVLTIGMVRKAAWVQSVAYAQEYGIKTANLIVGNVYGPFDYFDDVKSYVCGALIGKIVRAKQNNVPSASIWGTGDPVRDFVFDDDVVDAFLKALEVDTGTDPINVSGGEGVSVKELANIIKEESGYTGTLEFDTSKPDGAPYKVMNIDLAKEVLGWEPKTTLREGIRKSIESL